MKKKDTSYGKELLIDLIDCDIKKFNRKSLKKFFIELCELIDMSREKLNFFDMMDTEDDKRIVGITAIQFIMTSNITVHANKSTEKANINIFSCKDFNEKVAVPFVEKWFKGEAVQTFVIDRK